VKSEQNK